MEDNDYYIQLIAKHLNGATSPDEEVALQQWLDSDPEHRLEFEALTKIWQTGGTVINSRRFDEKAAWKKVDPRARRLVWLRNLVAASVVLVLGASGWWYYTSHKKDAWQHVVASEDVRQLSLPDGSVVWLRRGAGLDYPNVFDQRFRQVELTGEAFFQPAADPSRPFRIHTAHATIEDIATSFLVKDYNAGGEVVVATGKVKLTGREDPSHPLVLSPGQKATITKNKLSLSGLGTPNFMSWKTGLLEFRQTPLDLVVQDINDHYKSSISIAPDLRAGAAEIKVTARFDHQPLEQVLEEVRLTTGLQTTQEKDTLFFIRQ